MRENRENCGGINTIYPAVSLLNSIMSPGFSQEAETLLKQWHKKTSKSAIDLIQKMFKTVKDHWDGILSYLDSELTTGFLEGINILIQAAKARARGYRTIGNT